MTVELWMWGALGALVVVTPWTLRNYHEYGRVVLVASSGGVNFWAGNHPLSPGEGGGRNPASVSRCETKQPSMRSLRSLSSGESSRVCARSVGGRNS